MSLEVLKRIALLLNQEGIVWELGGSLMLKQKGLVEVANDIDLLIAESDVERAHELLSTLRSGSKRRCEGPELQRVFLHA